MQGELAKDRGVNVCLVSKVMNVSLVVWNMHHPRNQQRARRKRLHGQACDNVPKPPAIKVEGPFEAEQGT
jgi:hypothetical protein